MSNLSSHSVSQSVSQTVVPNLQVCLILYYTNLVCAGFYEDSENCRFGTKPKAKEKPASDFNFEFIAKVAASHPSSTGFLVNVFPERNQQEEVVSM